MAQLHGYSWMSCDESAMDRSKSNPASQDSMIDSLTQLHIRLQRMEVSCVDAREAVVDMAENLRQRITEHKRRLLAEIDNFQESQYRRCGIADSADIESLLKGLEKESPAEKVDSGNDVDKKLDKIKLDSYAAVCMVKFNRIRCNTAFGSVDMCFETSSRHVKTMRSLSVGQGITENMFLSVVPNNTIRPRSNSISMATLFQNASPGSVTHALSPAIAAEKQKLWQDMRLFTASPGFSPQLSTAMESTQNEASNSLSKNCIWKVNKEGSQLGEVNCPNDVVFLSNHSIVIADRNNKRLQQFDRYGTPMKTYAVDQIKPKCLAVMGDEGQIAITDTDQNCVKIVNLRDDTVQVWSSKKSKTNLQCPCGVAVNSRGQYIISDLERHTVTIFSRECKPSKNIQCSSSTEFHSPSYLSVDKADRIVISDSWHQSLYVFDKSGKLDFEVSSTDPAQGGYLKYPNGICADEDGNIYVADWGNHAVSMFSSTGNFIKHVLDRSDNILHPAGVAVQAGYLALTEYSDSHSAVGVYTINKEE